MGVLALQGDVDLHRQAVEACRARSLAVRTLEEIDAGDGLIIPGGESSTVGILLERYGMMEPLRARIREGMPVYGTCMGLILLAEEIEASRQPHLGVLDIAVRRNAYGRQIDSFECEVEIAEIDGGPYRAVFIRAPRITRVGPDVQVLADSKWGPVLVRKGTVLGGTFHPETTSDVRVHEYFLDMIEAAA